MSVDRNSGYQRPSPLPDEREDCYDLGYQDALATLERRGVITTDPSEAEKCCGIERDEDGFCQHRQHHPIAIKSGVGASTREDEGAVDAGSVLGKASESGAGSPPQSHPQDDLRRIMEALNIPTHARPVSAHEVCCVEVLPRIWEWRHFLEYLAITTGPDGDKAQELLKESTRRAKWLPK